MNLVAAMLMLAAAPADAVSTPAPAPPSASAQQADKSDPIVCESSQELGSRLKRRKVCLHRSEWRAQRQEETQMINRTQVQRGVEGGN